jgi:hypothetical protein
MMGQVRYLNSGDWVESLTAIVEETDGQIRVVDHVELRRRIAAQRAQFEASQTAEVLNLRANPEPVVA